MMKVKAPYGFKPDDAETRTVHAPPVHSRYRKFDLYRSVQQFQHIDDHAVKVSQTDHDNFTDLIWHLVYSNNLQSDLDKTRVIFRWMTSKNMYTIDFKEGAKPGSPEEILTSFKTKQGTYARIFETLCRFSGVTSMVLTGFAKGLDYRPGDRFKGTDYNHSWNAVLIDSNWYLVDSHWATRYLVSEKNIAENLVYEYDDFYFLTDPEQLIYSHWAQDNDWQLLAQPVSQHDFENLPLVKSYFFKCGMFFVSHHNGVVDTKKGRIALTLGYCKPTNFTYKVVFADSGEELYQGQKLKNFALQHHGQNQTGTFVFRAPKAGQYYFTFFAQLLTGELGVKSIFTAACEYKVVADTASPDAVPLPLCSDSCWGPGAAVEQLGLVPSTTDGIIATDNGRVNLEFQKTKPAFILCKLRRNGVEEEELEKYINDKDTGESVQVTANLPSRGEYGIEVYGNDPARDGDTYTHVCQYFVHFASPSEQKQAFYQESPEGRAVMGDSVQQTTVPSGYTAGNFELSDATTNLNLTDPDSLPPPPPELLQQQYLYGTVPDSRQKKPVVSKVTFTPSRGRNQNFATYAPGTGQLEVSVPGPGQMNDTQRRSPTPQSVLATATYIPASEKPLEVQRRTVGQAAPAAPQDFQLVTVTEDKGEAPPPIPAPGPQQKPTLEAIDHQVLQSVDDHAIQVSKSEHNSFRDLVWDLIYSKNITNEIEKVRVIFRWLATKNLKEMNFDRIEKGSPEEVLMGLKTGATTYAMVFDTMCKFAGLHSQIIGGYAKGADYLPGMKFRPGQNQHTWNAVYIYGTWCLIDPHWAARRLVGKQTASEDFHYQLDEYFFLPDPHQLIYTHFPDDARWQLLDHSITLEEFESMPHMKPQFFKYGLEFVTHRTAVIRSRGETHIRLRYPAHKFAVAFNFTIQFENGDDEFKGTKLNRYGLLESEGGIASFSIRLPVSGSYMLFIFAKEDVAEKTENVYSQVCEYKIEHEAVPGSPPEPYPPCSSLTWGPGSAFYRYGLSTYQQSPVMYTRDGKAELQIRQSRPIQFTAKLKHNNINEGDLEAYVMHRIVGNTAFFSVTAPGRGEYGLEIYANDPDTEGQILYHNAQFLVVCNEDVKTTPLPKLPPGYLGAQPKFSEFGMVTASHQDPIIHLDCNSVTVMLKCEQSMRVLANLISVDEEKDYNDFTFSNAMGSNIAFEVSLPQTGFFKLQLYGIPVLDKSQNLPGVFNYLINCRKVTQAVFPFPKQYAQWKEGCFMAKPGVIPTTRGPFANNVRKDQLPDTIDFDVTVPNAKSVAVVVDQDWTHLEQTGGDAWVGSIKVGHIYGTNTRVTLNANYGGDKTSYATLLEYTL